MTKFSPTSFENKISFDFGDLGYMNDKGSGFLNTPFVARNVRQQVELMYNMGKLKGEFDFGDLAYLTPAASEFMNGGYTEKLPENYIEDLIQDWRETRTFDFSSFRATILDAGFSDFKFGDLHKLDSDYEAMDAPRIRSGFVQKFREALEIYSDSDFGDLYKLAPEYEMLDRPHISDQEMQAWLDQVKETGSFDFMKLKMNVLNNLADAPKQDVDPDDREQQEQQIDADDREQTAPVEEIQESRQIRGKQQEEARDAKNIEEAQKEDGNVKFENDPNFVGPRILAPEGEQQAESHISSSDGVTELDSSRVEYLGIMLVEMAPTNATLLANTINKYTAAEIAAVPSTSVAQAISSIAKYENNSAEALESINLIFDSGFNIANYSDDDLFDTMERFSENGEAGAATAEVLIQNLPDSYFADFAPNNITKMYSIISNMVDVRDIDAIQVLANKAAPHLQFRMQSLLHTPIWKMTTAKEFDLIEDLLDGVPAGDAAKAMMSVLSFSSRFTDALSVESVDNLMGEFGYDANDDRLFGMMAREMIAKDNLEMFKAVFNNLSDNDAEQFKAELKEVLETGEGGRWDVDVSKLDGIDFLFKSGPSGENNEDLRSDLNSDGVVDANDLKIAQENYGTLVDSDAFVLGDVNGDGAVDAADFTIIRDDFGQQPEILSGEGSDNTIAPPNPDDVVFEEPKASQPPEPQPTGSPTQAPEPDIDLSEQLMNLAENGDVEGIRDFLETLSPDDITNIDWESTGIALKAMADEGAHGIDSAFDVMGKILAVFGENIRFDYVSDTLSNLAQSGSIQGVEVFIGNLDADMRNEIDSESTGTALKAMAQEGVLLDGYPQDAAFEVMGTVLHHFSDNIRPDLVGDALHTLAENQSVKGVGVFLRNLDEGLWNDIDDAETGFAVEQMANAGAQGDPLALGLMVDILSRFEGNISVESVNYALETLVQLDSTDAEWIVSFFNNLDDGLLSQMDQNLVEQARELAGIEAPGDIIVGTEGGDLLIGTDGDDFMEGRGGNDDMRGGAGDDVMYGDYEYVTPMPEPNPPVLVIRPGDINFDGRVDAEDMAIWKSEYKQSEDADLRADLNGDGVVDTADYTLLRDNMDSEKPVSRPEPRVRTNNDRMYGGAGDDEMHGGLGNDKLNGGAGDDFLDGGRGDDVLIAGQGRDTMVGGQGKDIFSINVHESGLNTITDFEAGVDKIRIGNYVRRFGSPEKVEGESLEFFQDDNGDVWVSFKQTPQGAQAPWHLPEDESREVLLVKNTTIAEVQAALQTTIDFTTEPNVIKGTGDDDTVYGSKNADIMSGLGGDDNMHGHDGDDVMYGDYGPNDPQPMFSPPMIPGDLNHDYKVDLLDMDILVNSFGIDNLNADLNRDGVVDTADYAILRDNFGAEWISPTFNDTMNGGAGDDILDGGQGDDILIAGQGADTLIGGTGADTFVVSAHDNELNTIKDFEAGIDTIVIDRTSNLPLNTFVKRGPSDSHLEFTQTQDGHVLVTFHTRPRTGGFVNNENFTVTEILLVENATIAEVQAGLETTIPFTPALIGSEGHDTITLHPPGDYVDADDREQVAPVSEDLKAHAEQYDPAEYEARPPLYSRMPDPQQSDVDSSKVTIDEDGLWSYDGDALFFGIIESSLSDLTDLINESIIEGHIQIQDILGEGASALDNAIADMLTVTGTEQDHSVVSVDNGDQTGSHDVLMVENTSAADVVEAIELMGYIAPIDL